LTIITLTKVPQPVDRPGHAGGFEGKKNLASARKFPDPAEDAAEEGISPQMIRDGVRAWALWSEDDDLPENLVKLVYLAMKRALEVFPD
jgi:hypothetical protein